jgi:peptidoglycan/xylan/chitin deacetylase (PgdA/CDA1 family)
MLTFILSISFVIIFLTIITVVLLPSLWVRFILKPLLPGIIFCGHGRRRELALTIDDGPSPETGVQLRAGSMALLALLRELEVPVTLFVISDHLIQGDSGYLQKALADGHNIGHHMNEDNISACLAPDLFRLAFDEAAENLQFAAAPHRLNMRWFRPGGGWFRISMLRSIRERGYYLVLGSVFPWDTFHPPLNWMSWFVLKNAHPGAILILHDRPDTLNATMSLLRLVVPALRGSGYRFVTLEGLLNT